MLHFDQILQVSLKTSDPDPTFYLFWSLKIQEIGELYVNYKRR